MRGDPSPVECLEHQFIGGIESPRGFPIDNQRVVGLIPQDVLVIEIAVAYYLVELQHGQGRCLQFHHLEQVIQPGFQQLAFTHIAPASELNQVDHPFGGQRQGRRIV